jgi:hypothetical protein
MMHVENLLRPLQLFYLLTLPCIVVVTGKFWSHPEMKFYKTVGCCSEGLALLLHIDNIPSLNFP